MTQTTITPERVEENTDRARIRHIYYVRLNGGVPQIGDLALCGHRKVTPPGAPRLCGPYPDDCIVCGDLWEMGVSCKL